jgi:hypothetical protein
MENKKNIVDVPMTNHKSRVLYVFSGKMDSHEVWGEAITDAVFDVPYVEILGRNLLRLLFLCFQMWKRSDAAMNARNCR